MVPLNVPLITGSFRDRFVTVSFVRNSSLCCALKPLVVEDHALLVAVRKWERRSVHVCSMKRTISCFFNQFGSGGLHFNLLHRIHQYVSTAVHSFQCSGCCFTQRACRYEHLGLEAICCQWQSFAGVIQQAGTCICCRGLAGLSCNIASPLVTVCTCKQYSGCVFAALVQKGGLPTCCLKAIGAECR